MSTKSLEQQLKTAVELLEELYEQLPAALREAYINGAQDGFKMTSSQIAAPGHEMWELSETKKMIDSETLSS